MENKLKEKIIEEIIWTCTKQGAFQRSYIYKTGILITNEDKEKLRNHIKDFCRFNLFNLPVNVALSENELLSIIENLCNTTASNFGKILNNDEFQFGNAQKFINLYLKMLWVLGRIGFPPHFPVDRIIQKRIISKKTIPWTNMNKKEYLSVIESAKRLAEIENLSLAEWEAGDFAEFDHPVSDQTDHHQPEQIDHLVSD